MSLGNKRPRCDGALGALLVGLGYGPITPAGSDLLKRVTPARLQPVEFSVKQAAVPAAGANSFSHRAFAGQLPLARNPDNAAAFGGVTGSMF
jgi:hypothetical protein